MATERAPVPFSTFATGSPAKAGVRERSFVVTPFWLIGGQERGPGQAPAPPAPPDAILPVISNFSPAPGTQIDTTDVISFDVTDNLGLFTRIIVTATIRGVMEVVHDGDAFRGFYASASGRVLIANGFRYTVGRTGGWTGTPTFEIFAIDTAGNEAI